MSVQRLVVGLGNPGPRYSDTRHNVGFDVVRALAARLGCRLDEPRFSGRFGTARMGEADIGLLLPETFMNRSGQSVAEAVRAFGLTAPEVLVVFDDLDLPFGRLRLRPRGGPGGHNGLGDVIRALDGPDVPRLRFGIGRPPDGIEPIAYVLDAFAPEERQALPGLIDAAVEGVTLTLEVGVTDAMNRVNRVKAGDPRENPSNRNREPS